MGEIAEYLRTLGWYESHLFGFYFIHTPLAVTLRPDGWSIGERTGQQPGEYKVFARGTTLAELQQALGKREAAEGGRKESQS